MSDKFYDEKGFIIKKIFNSKEINLLKKKILEKILDKDKTTKLKKINIKNLHNIIFASPTKSRIRSLQSIGRALRKSNNNKIAVLYDIVDDLRYKKYVNFVCRHFYKRLDIYNEEQFKFKINNIDIK